MGMYTELVCAFTLIEELPGQVVDVLRYLVREAPEPVELPEHCFFQAERWRGVIRGVSAYFPGFPHSSLCFYDFTKHYELTVRVSIKNYDFEIEKFIDWLSPYITASDGEFLGYKRYEEDARPTLLVHPGKWIEPLRSRFWWRRWLNRG